MSLLSAAYMLERYGLRLNIEQMAEVLGMSPGAVRNQVSAETFPLPTYLDGGRRWCDYRDVADYLDSCRERAKAKASATTPA